MLCPGRSNLLSPVFYRTLLEQGFAGRSPSFASRSGVLSPPARARVLRLKGWYCIWRDLWIYSIHVGTPLRSTNNRPSRFTSLGLFSLYALLIISASVILNLPARSAALVAIRPSAALFRVNIWF